MPYYTSEGQIFNIRRKIIDSIPCCDYNEDKGRKRFPAAFQSLIYGRYWIVFAFWSDRRNTNGFICNHHMERKQETKHLFPFVELLSWGKNWSGFTDCGKIHLVIQTFTKLRVPSSLTAKILFRLFCPNLLVRCVFLKSRYNAKVIITIRIQNSGNSQ